MILRSLISLFEWLATWIKTPVKTRIVQVESEGSLNGMYEPEIKTNSGWLSIGYPCDTEQEAREALDEELGDDRMETPYWLHITILALKYIHKRPTPDLQAPTS